MFLALLDNVQLSLEEENDIKIFTATATSGLIENLALKILNDNENDILFIICLYLITKYTNLRAEIVDLFIIFMKKKYINKYNISNYEIEKKYSKEEIEKISFKDLINDIGKIYDQKLNYVAFVVEEGLLKVQQMTLDKITHLIKETNISPNEKKKNCKKDTFEKISNDKDEGGINSSGEKKENQALKNEKDLSLEKINEIEDLKIIIII